MLLVLIKPYSSFINDQPTRIKQTNFGRIKIPVQKISYCEITWQPLDFVFYPSSKIKAIIIIWNKNTAKSVADWTIKTDSQVFWICLLVIVQLATALISFFSINHLQPSRPVPYFLVNHRSQAEYNLAECPHCSYWGYVIFFRLSLVQVRYGLGKVPWVSNWIITGSSCVSCEAKKKCNKNQVGYEPPCKILAFVLLVYCFFFSSQTTPLNLTAGRKKHYY
jgi:hypothetical protein